MVETQLVDVVGDAGMLAALGKGRADALLRQAETVDGSLAVELRVEVETLGLDGVGKKTLPRPLPGGRGVDTSSACIFLYFAASAICLTRARFF